MERKKNLNLDILVSKRSYQYGSYREVKQNSSSRTLKIHEFVEQRREEGVWNLIPRGEYRENKLNRRVESRLDGTTDFI